VKIGDRVRTRITRTEDYAMGCAAMLTDQVGVIKEIKSDKDPLFTYAFSDKPHALVGFDPPLPSTWTSGSPISGFWFPFDELEVIP
jgi:hypothetical protein